VVFVTNEYWGASIRSGFHFLAKDFHDVGWDVLFITAHLSWFAAWLGRRRRFARLARRDANRLIQKDGVLSYVWSTPWHAVNLRLALLNRATRKLFARYGSLPLGVEPLVASADRIIFDSGPGLLLFDRFKQLNPRAPLVYRVSDDLRYARVHPVVLEAEAAVAPRFDLVSSPCADIHDRFRHLPQATLDHHGVEKALFDQRYPTPYPRGEAPQVVYSGQHRFDRDFLERASTLLPDWTFHILGPIRNLPRRENIRAYGEMLFAETVPFIKNADIGLQSLVAGPGAAALTDTPKILQYTYCRLPVVAPTFLTGSWPNVFYYRPGDSQSIRKALLQARRLDRGSIDVSRVPSWGELADRLGRNSAPPIA
jgi:2-beta-glucuronyltransferase